MVVITQTVQQIEQCCSQDLKPLYIWLTDYITACASTVSDELRNEVISIVSKTVSLYTTCNDLAQKRLIDKWNQMWINLTEATDFPDVTSTLRIMVKLKANSKSTIGLNEIPTNADPKLNTKSDSKSKPSNVNARKNKASNVCIPEKASKLSKSSGNPRETPIIVDNTPETTEHNVPISNKFDAITENSLEEVDSSATSQIISQPKTRKVP